MQSRLILILITLLVLFVAVKHLEAGAVARSESKRIAIAVEKKDRSIEQIQALTETALKQQGARMKAAQEEIFVLRQRMGALKVPEPTGKTCPAGCEVLWPEK